MHASQQLPRQEGIQVHHHKEDRTLYSSSNKACKRNTRKVQYMTVILSTGNKVMVFVSHYQGKHVAYLTETP